MKSLSLKKHPKQVQELTAQVADYPYFKTVPLSLLEEVIKNAELCELKKDDVLIKQGASSDRMVYVLLSGLFHILADGQYILKLDEPGLTIGEMAVINPTEKRSADVVAQGSAKVLGIPTSFLDGTDIDSLRLANSFMRMFSGILAVKLQATTDRAKLYESAVLETQEATKYNEKILGESKDLKQELQLKLEQIKLYSEVVESNQDAILICDEQASLLSANQAFSQLFGYGGEDLAKLSMFDLFQSLAPSGKEFFQKVSDGWRGESEAVKQDTTTFPTILTVTPVKTQVSKAGEKKTLYATIIRDVTKWKEYESHIIKTNQELQQTHSELEKTLEELEKSNQIKDQFLSNISTQLKTPLVSLINYGDLMFQELAKAPKNTYAEKRLTQIIDEGKKVEKMVGNLLIMAELTPELSNFHFSNLMIEEVINQVTRRLEQNDRIQWDVDHRVKFIKADPEKFIMAFVDVLEFALFFKDQTSQVFVQMTLSNNDSYLEVKISIGEVSCILPIPKEEALSDGIEVQIQDAEIHLPRAKRIIELHQGEMQIHSEDHSGSILVRVAVDPVSESNSLVKVMIVDDKPFDRKLLKGTIEKHLQTTDIFEFATQMEALNALNAVKPNLLIVDPDFKNGDWTYDVFLEKLLEVDPENTSTLVVSDVLHKLDARKNIINLGITDFLFKPFTIQDIAFKVKSIIETKQRFYLLSSNVEKAEKSAATDGLTGLFNRKYYDQYVEEQILKAEVAGTNVSLIMIDVDNFKHYNDTNGHPLGDVVLTQVSRLLKQNVRANDMVARYGGEEFVVVLPGAGHIVGQKVAEVLRSIIEETPFPKENTQPLKKITASFGVSTYPEHGHDQKVLLKIADNCLYKAKANGRNRVVLATVEE